MFIRKILKKTIGSPSRSNEENTAAPAIVVIDYSTDTHQGGLRRTYAVQNLADLAGKAASCDDSEDAESESIDVEKNPEANLRFLGSKLAVQKREYSHSSEIHSSDEMKEAKDNVAKAHFFTIFKLDTSRYIKVPVAARRVTASEIADEKMGIDRKDIYIL